MSKNVYFQDLIKSTEEATKVLKKLNEKLKEAIKDRYTPEEKQQFIDCVRDYCLLHKIRARFDTRDENRTYIYYHYWDERPIIIYQGLGIGKPMYTVIEWGKVKSLTDCLDTVLEHIRINVTSEM